MLRYMIPALLLLSVLTCGCIAPKPEEEPIDGGNTHTKDPDAPDHITSSHITELQADFFLATRWHGDEDGFFNFSVTENEDGSYTVIEKNTQLSTSADASMLNQLQAVIKKYDLVSMNGVYDVTAGLPPEYQPGGLTVIYDSGEKLSFTTDNNPYAEWAEEFYDIIAEQYAENGEEGLYPDPDTSLIAKMRIHLIDDNLEYSYGGVNVSQSDAIKGETYLLNRSVYDLKKNKTVKDKYLLFPDDYYEKITDIINSYGLVRTYDFSRYDHEANNYGNHERGYYGMGPHPEDEEDSETKSLRFSLTFESGKRMSVETKKESEIEAFRPLINELIVYIDSLK